MPSMPTRRLEDRIRELCGHALYETGTQWQHTIHLLQMAIREHLLRVANRAAAATLVGRPEVLRERRDGSHGGGGVES